MVPNKLAFVHIHMYMYTRSTSRQKTAMFAIQYTINVRQSLTIRFILNFLLFASCSWLSSYIYSLSIDTKKSRGSYSDQSETIDSVPHLKDL